jgi:hypothetical protein
VAGGVTVLGAATLLVILGAQASPQGGNACPTALVCGRLIERGTITDKHIKDGSLSLNDLSAKARNSLRGARGPAGQTGATGATGAPGAPGATGPPGPASLPTIDYNNFDATLPAGDFFITTVCDAGLRVVSGGITHNGTGTQLVVTDSFPSDGNATTPASGTVAWTIFGSISGVVSLNVRGFAICMPAAAITTMFAPEAARAANLGSAGPIPE